MIVQRPDRRVVITGMGTINPLGHSVAQTWEAVVNGRSGIQRISHFDPTDFSSQVAGEVRDFSPDSYYSETHVKLGRRMDPFVHYAVAAAKEAVESSGIDFAADPRRAGVAVGSGIGGLNVQVENITKLNARGPRGVSPLYIPTMIGNMAAGLISIMHGLKGPSIATQTACATGNHALSSAMLIIQCGMADVMLAGGTEGSVIPITVAGFANMRALSTRFNAEPQRASRPYDRNRDGFVIAEGAAVLVLEEYEHAKARGAQILAEIRAVGMSGDAYDMVAPDPEGEGALASMQLALEMAGVAAADIDYVNAHGTSTPLGDLAEARAIYALLNGNEDHVHVGSTKSMHGHLLGATAALEAVICVEAIRHAVVPPNLNLDELDPDVVLRCINTAAVEKPIRHVLSNSFGFGGHNSTAVFSAI